MSADSTNDHLISIHALREEGDLWLAFIESLDLDISIHALREEGDPDCQAWQPKQGQFLSTPSARRATAMCRCRILVMCHFYPRPPRGGRRCKNCFSVPS